MVKVKTPSTAGKNHKKAVIKPKAKTTIKPVKKETLGQEHIEGAIRMKAYELYILRQGQNGDALNDWLSAERIILKKF